LRTRRPCGFRWFNGACKSGVVAAAGHAPVLLDLERQAWAVRIADVNALTVVDVDDAYPASLDKRAVP
jgi:hypothetical protein